MKKVYFFGAGSTQFLGLPTSNQLYEKLLDCKNNEIKDFLKLFFKNKSNIQDIFNLLDYNILNHNTLKKNDKSYPPDKLEKIKISIKSCIVDILNQSVQENNESAYQELVYFYYNLAYQELINKSKHIDDDLASDHFIYSDYSIINLNWDIFSIIPILKAHQIINDLNHFNFNTNHPFQLRIYAGLAPYLTAKKKNDLWQPYTGLMAKKINNPKIKANRKLVIVKTYFPHGLICYKECPICKRITIPPLTEGFSIKEFQHKENKFCAYCNHPLTDKDICIEMQSNYKKLNPYFLQDINDMLLTLSDADEITFIGYSLPLDDLEFRNYFRTSIKDTANIRVVLYDEHYQNSKFVLKEKLDRLSNHNKEIMNRYLDIFGDKVLFDFSGVPNCFNNKELK